MSFSTPPHDEGFASVGVVNPDNLVICEADYCTFTQGLRIQIRQILPQIREKVDGRDGDTGSDGLDGESPKIWRRMFIREQQLGLVLACRIDGTFDFEQTEGGLNDCNADVDGLF